MISFSFPSGEKQELDKRLPTLCAIFVYRHKEFREFVMDNDNGVWLEKINGHNIQALNKFAFSYCYICFFHWSGIFTSSLFRGFFILIFRQV